MSISPRSLSIKFISPAQGLRNFRMQSAYCFLAVIVLAVLLNDAFASADANQTPLASRGSVVCNLIQESHVNTAIKNLETKLEILIALVNKTRPPQPTPTRKSLSLLI